MRDTLVTLFDGYHNDLAQLARVVVSDLASGDRPGVDLLGKLALETARIVVYEQYFLLPVLRDAVPDGTAVAAREAARVAGLAERMQVLERLPVDAPDFRPALIAFARGADELAEQRRASVYPALQTALDDEALADVGSRVTPTAEPGPTHSHPTEAKRYESMWPRPGFLTAMINVFADEVQLREPHATPVRS